MLRDGDQGKGKTDRAGRSGRDRKRPKDLHEGHRSRAKKRGIKFQMSLEEWISVWVDALGENWKDKRGRLKHQFCMARLGDKGPYAVGNVKIITNEENAKERVWTDQDRTDQSRRMKKRMADLTTRQLCSMAKKGKPGHPQTKESKAKISAAHLNKPSINKSRSKMGSKNPMFGWKWFNNGELARLFHPDQVPSGWSLGRRL